MVSISNNSRSSINLTSNNDTDVNANMNGNAQRAKSWAVGEGLIDGVDYSAKYYAGQAKESEEIASHAIENIDTAKDEAIAEMETAKEEKISEIENTAADFEVDLETLTTRAETAATNAETSATSASTSATNASNSATNAATSATQAWEYRGEAETYQSIALNASSRAEQYKNTAKDYRDAAEGYAQQAEQAKSAIEAELTDYATKVYVDNGLSTKQNTLVSGTNIKTINNESILGSGNITIQGGGAVDSVNGQTGTVVLTASDVGALPDSTVIPTVNNPTITFTQGGVTKGTITLNQSNNQTIALDAGGSGGGGTWGSITGTLSDQTDLQNALNAKLNTSDITEYTAQEVETLWGSI